MNNENLTPDEFRSDPIFESLRQFGDAPVAENTEALDRILLAYRENEVLRKRKFLRYFVTPIVVTAVVITTLAYAGLLPHQFSKSVKVAVTDLKKEITKPVTKVVDQISGNDDESIISPNPVNSPAIKNSHEEDGSGSGSGSVSTNGNSESGDDNSSGGHESEGGQPATISSPKPQPVLSQTPTPVGTPISGKPSIAGGSGGDSEGDGESDGGGDGGGDDGESEGDD